ncbi:MAG: sulfotransferase domain-containing protein [Myxococcales bacterium FL481]|nr:MAG: sulfotransferase domain-containing protein [Myxococcales bacterium FL481]
MSLPRRCVVFLSMFKSGTHLGRRLLAEMLEQPCFEPAIVRGRVDYEDSGQLYCPEGSFYSWHLQPNSAAIETIRAAAARPILLVRNLFDLCVSQYHHFADNIDADRGRGRNVQHYFEAMSRSDGLSAIVEGMARSDFRWRGLPYQIAHLEKLLDLAEAHPCCLMTYEQMVDDKRVALGRLAQFLSVEARDGWLDDLVAATSFQAMKTQAQVRGQASHFRRGRSGSHVDSLQPAHIQAISGMIDRVSPTLRERCARWGISAVLERGSGS